MDADPNLDFSDLDMQPFSRGMARSLMLSDIWAAGYRGILKERVELRHRNALIIFFEVTKDLDSMLSIEERFMRKQFDTIFAINQERLISRLLDGAYNEWLELSADKVKWSKLGF